MYIQRIKGVKAAFVSHSLLKARIYDILLKGWERELWSLEAMNEYNFRKACIIVGIKGNETMFRNYKFQSYKFVFSPKLFDNFLKFYVNRIVTTIIENKIRVSFKFIDVTTSRQMMIAAAGGECELIDDDDKML